MKILTQKPLDKPLKTWYNDKAVRENSTTARLEGQAIGYLEERNIRENGKEF